MRATRRLLPHTVGLALAAAVCVRIPAHAQVDLFSLEAAYIYNFTEFTEWPAGHAGSAPSASLVVCVNPRTDLAAALAKLDGRTVSGRAWSVKPIPDGAGVAQCNVLVVGDNLSNAAAKAALARDYPTLIVRAADADTNDGPYVVALVHEGDRLRFDIDNTEAVHRRLGLSSKLLRLARNVT